MNAANASPLTKKPTGVSPLTPKVPKEYEDLYGEYDYTDPVVREMVDAEIEYQSQQPAQRVRDLSSGKDRPLFEKIMAMRGEMMGVETSRKDTLNRLESLYELTEQQASRSIASILKDEPTFSKYLSDAFREGEGHWGNKIDTIEFVKEVVSKAGSSSKDIIQLKGEPAFSLDRFGKKPIDEDDSELETEEDGDGYTIRRTTKKRFDMLKNINYFLEEITEYTWNVDKIEDEDGEFRPDDEDIDYNNASETKTTYRLVKKNKSK